MRKKLDIKQKRSNIIGIKVKPETREQLQWIADREATKLSSYINDLLRIHIETYFKYNHIEWEALPEEEKKAYQNKKERRENNEIRKTV